jgi:plasmid stabilization system protein ParE
VTPRVLFRPGARVELREAQRWYEEQVAGLGVEFAKAVERAVEAIVQYPLAFTEVEPEFRQCVMPRFPYSLIYRVRESTIVIVAVHHQRRDPDAWRGRTA